MQSHANCLNINPFSGLFEFIQKNKKIVKGLSEAETNTEKQEELLNAINAGDADNSIFNDPQCYLYLLNLIKTNRIDFLEGMTVYAFLLACMQFTDRQPIRNADKDVKSIRPIRMSSLSKNGTLTAEGEKFLKSIHARLTMDHPLDYAELINVVLKLSPSEQWLIRFQYTDTNLTHYRYGDHINSFSNILIANIPFAHKEVSETDYECWVPSVSLIDFILQKISSSPLKMKFCYGSIGKDKLKQLHSQHIHPVSLYGLDVLSNPKEADNYRCGPFLMWLHDIGHTYWGSTLSAEERHFIFNEFIPQVELLKKNQDEAVSKKFQSVIDRAIDFNLTPLSVFRGGNRFHVYLSRSLGNGRGRFLYPRLPSLLYNVPLGEPVEDRVYFLLKKVFYSLPAGKTKEIWGSVLELMIDRVDPDRSPDIIDKIDKIAYAMSTATFRHNGYSPSLFAADNRIINDDSMAENFVSKKFNS